MADQYADLVTGAALSLEILVRHLEREGALDKGSYREALEEYLSHVSPVRRDSAMYAVPKTLVKALAGRLQSQNASIDPLTQLFIVQVNRCHD